MSDILAEEKREVMERLKIQLQIKISSLKTELKSFEAYLLDIETSLLNELTKAPHE